MPYFIVPFLRSSPEAACELRVDGEAAPRLQAQITRPNGQVAASGAEVLADPFAHAEVGAAHVDAEAPALAFHERRAGGTRTALFSPVDDLAGTEWTIDATDEAEPAAVLANASESELFVFVNDNQGPFIPPGGCARIQVPRPGGPLRVTVENGDAVLAYRGAPVRPSR